MIGVADGAVIGITSDRAVRIANGISEVAGGRARDTYIASEGL